MENVLALEVSEIADIVDASENLTRFVAENFIDFLGGPDEEFAFFSFAISVLGCIKSTLAVKHLPKQIIGGFLGHIFEQLVPCDTIKLGVDTQELSVVIQHLLEMGHQPFLVDGITMEAATQVIVDAS